MTDQTTKPTLTEYCGNCGLFVWHDLLLELEGNVWMLLPINHPTTGCCTHTLMKHDGAHRDVTRIECLFWKPIDLGGAI